MFTQVRRNFGCMAKPTEEPKSGLEPDQPTVSSSKDVASGDPAPPQAERLDGIEVVEHSDDSEEALLSGWRQQNSTVSLQESNATIGVPAVEASWWRQWSAYVGVGFMVSVG